MGIIVPLKPVEIETPPNQVLEEAVDNYEALLLLGYNVHGQIDIRASSNLNHAEILWLIEIFKRKLLDGDYSDA
jgi:hypothetical protein